MLKRTLLFSVCVIIFIASCTKKNNSTPIYASWGITSNPTGNSPQFIFDWNVTKKANANNLSNFLNINSIQDSIRFVMIYSFVNPSVDSSQITIHNNLQTYVTKRPESYDGTAALPDTFGKSPLYEITSLNNYPFVAQNFLTVPFVFYYYKDITHIISLVYDNNNLWNATSDTMTVELRHNPKGDTITTSYPYSINASVAFNLNGLKPATAPRDSFFIKMIYNTVSSVTGDKTDTILIGAKWQN